VLTDFVAHRYWADPQVDLYVAPSMDVQETLVAQGVSPERVEVTGIPIGEKYLQPVDRAAVVKSLNLKPDLPKLLVMGGSLGLGPMKAVIRKLDKLPQPFEMIAVTGQNDELKESLEKRGGKLRHHTKIYGFVEHIHELMEIADMIITKPGGITTAEALAKQLPMIIVNPIPGQEAKNTEYLLRHQVAVEAGDASDVALYVDDFFRNPGKVRQMRAATATLGCPRAAEQAARSILSLLEPVATVAA
jgi:processive 1,2-diacylglycerol beta-glucosyltransferase